MRVKLLALLLLAVFVSGCAHCSKTVSEFNGKTKGINPYGDGELKVVRESYWGSQKCVESLSKMEVKNEDAGN